ncbi:GNAT family N-acetyltransferase [Negadavirga shengliensis]|uniref:GNAT family N-acetyltransferase n=1 Tax=Negadavirga shengliensis TaxID=1389218 RepID=A0ABV9SYT6_9BACT
MDIDFGIKNLEFKDLEVAMRLKDEEGWNQTVEDWKLFYEQNPHLCLKAEVDGETVATVTAINYQNRLSWIGMMLVDKRYRGRGISQSLMGAIIDRLQDCSSVKLDATPAGFHVYKKLGFEKEYSLNRMVRVDQSKMIPDEAMVHMRPIEEKDMTTILKLDIPVFGADRQAVLRHLRRTFPEGAMGIWEEEELKGFLFCRKGSRYIQLGPMVAYEDAFALRLLKSAIHKFSGERLVLDIAMDKKNLIEGLKEAGFEVQRELIRMYLKSNLYKGDPHRYYLICGPELG